MKTPVCEWTHILPALRWLDDYDQAHPSCGRCGQPAVAVVVSCPQSAQMYRTETVCPSCLATIPRQERVHVGYRPWLGASQGKEAR